MAEVTIHPAAEAEYQGALEWYPERSSQAAARFEIAFDRAIEFIRSQPTMFPRCDPVHRFILLKRYPYSLIYRVDGDSVRVIAVAHTKRRPGYWSQRV